MAHRLALVLVVPAMLAALAVPALARGPSLTVRPASVAPGAKVHISGAIPLGSCSRAGGVLVLSRAFARGATGFAGVQGVTAALSKTGAFKVTVRIPRKRHRGVYDVFGRCGGGNFGRNQKIRVT